MGNKVQINSYIQNYLQPLAFIGSALWLGRRFNNVNSLLIAGGLTAAGTYVARKTKLSSLLGKVAIISVSSISMSFASKKLRGRTSLSIEGLPSLFKAHLLIAVLFSLCEGAYIYSKKSQPDPLDPYKELTGAISRGKEYTCEDLETWSRLVERLFKEELASPEWGFKRDVNLTFIKNVGSNAHRYSKLFYRHPDAVEKLSGAKQLEWNTTFYKNKFYDLL